MLCDKCAYFCDNDEFVLRLFDSRVRRDRVFCVRCIIDTLLEERHECNNEDATV